MASKVFGVGQCPLDEFRGWPQCDLFVEGSLCAIYSWRPPSWYIPEENKLTTLEALLCRPGDSDTRHPTIEDGIPYFRDIREQRCVLDNRFFFSATAVAIKFRKFSVVIHFTRSRSGDCISNASAALVFTSKNLLTARKVNQLPKRKRQHLQHIIIDEDSWSVNNAEVHTQGLIQLCRENTELLVGQRTGLLRNILPSDHTDMIDLQGWILATPYLLTTMK